MKSLFFWIVLPILLLILLYYWLTLKIAKIDVKFDVGRFKVHDLSLIDVIKTGETHFQVVINVSVTNKNNFAITFKDLYIELFYQGKLISKSKDLITSTILVPANSTTVFSDALDVKVNKNVIELVAQLKNQERAAIDYMILVKVFGIPFTIKDTFINK